MTRTVVIRRARQADAVAVSALTTVLGYAADAAVVRRRIIRLAKRRDHVVFVAERGGKLVAWIHAAQTDSLESGIRVEIAGLVVDEGARRLGLGRKLVRQVEDWARRRRIATVVVRSNLQRFESHQFYPALGYAQAKTQAVYRKTVSSAHQP